MVWGGWKTQPKRASRLFVSPWSGCFASFARSVRYQWRVAATCGTQPETSETFVTMSMAHEWRPCTWRVNAQLEAWMLLGRVFDMVCSMDVNINLFLFVLPAVLLCFEACAAGCPTFIPFTAGTAACWAAGLWKGLLPASSLWGQRASVRLPAQKLLVPEKLKSLCFTF